MESTPAAGVLIGCDVGEIGGAHVTPMDRKAGKEFLREVSDTLYREWDPIGVRDMGGPTDEYEDYAGPIASMLIKGDTDEALLKFLEWAEIEQMGLGGPFDPRTVQKVIAALRQLPLPKSN